MRIYERRARELSTMEGGTGRLPKLMVVLTGKGPLREKYMMEVEKLQGKWEWVRCISLWLEAEDYPLLLGMSFACL
jgi:beta-1,4-mannosyltransferase